MPLVSVILPVHKPKTEHLEKALLSLKLASPEDTEVLIGLDGPCDRTVTEAIFRIAELQQKPRIRVLDFPRNGISKTLNRLIDASDSRWIARQDSDDCSLPERIIKQITEIEQRPGAGFCGTQIIRCNRDLTPFKIQAHHPRKFASQLVYASLLNNPIAHPTLVINRQALGETRYREASGMEDWQLYIDLWNKGISSFNLNDPGLLYRIHAKQVTAQNRDWKKITTMKEHSLKAATHNFPLFCTLLPLQKTSNAFEISKRLITLRNKFFLLP